MKGRSVRFVVLVAALGVGACGGTTDVLDELSQSEAADLASAVLLATFSNTGSVPQAPPATAGGPQLVPFTFSFHLDFPAECPLSGTVAISASLDVEGDTDTDAGTVDYVMIQVHHGCTVESENGRVFTLDGAPSVTSTLRAENDGQGVVSWSGSLVGTVAWSTDGRSGVCGLDLTFSGSGDDSAGTAEFDLAGTVCALSLDHSGSIG